MSWRGKWKPEPRGRCDVDGVVCCVYCMEDWDAAWVRASRWLWSRKPVLHLAGRCVSS